jgi:predicted Holliday junction resolvase-like endonuclease
VDVPDILLVALVAAAGLGWIAAYFLFTAWRKAAHGKRSQSSRYGKLTEQFAPWMRDWPFEDAQGFRFLGTPIDGVQFDEDAVYLVEIKAAGSRLSPRQVALRDAVLKGRVGWATVHIAERARAEDVRRWKR